MSEWSTRHSQVDYHSKKTRASILIVLVETLKDCSPKLAILCTFKPTFKNNNWPFKEQHAHDCVLSTNRKQWENQSDSWIFNRPWLSFTK